MNSLFITGTSGFIGSRLVRRLTPLNYEHIFCLSRTGCDNLSYLQKYDNVQVLRGSLFDSESYIHQLSKSDIVIHLAAVTGKAKSEEYFNINSKGTDFLLEQCIKSGVKKFLHVSSIAVKFQDIKNYPYAQSKVMAEECVKASGIPNTILRPTIVIGEGSSILSSLSKLGNLPVVPIFGDGSVLIQPIFIEDLISCILNIIENNIFDNEAIDIGGPEQVTIESFIKKLLKLSSNRNPSVIHIPIRPIMKILGFMENHFFSIMPVTSGQLASFSNDGTVDRNLIFDRYFSSMKNVDEMLNLVLSKAMKIDTSKVDLKRECKRFTEYLINCKPNEYIENKYIAGYKLSSIKINIGCFDTFLIKAANRNAFMIKLADVYTAVFYRKAVLRKKLILLLAILESYPATYSKIDSVSEDSILSLFIKTIQKPIVFSLLLFVSSIVFFPIRTMCYLRSLKPKKIL